MGNFDERLERVEPWVNFMGGDTDEGGVPLSTSAMLSGWPSAAAEAPDPLLESESSKAPSPT